MAGIYIGCSRSSKVVDFGTNRKGVCDFLLVIGNFGPILTVSEIRRLIGWKLQIFPTSLSCSASIGVNPFEFLDELSIAKTRVLGLSVDVDFVILACVVLTQCHYIVWQTDRQTDRWTERYPDHSSALEHVTASWVCSNVLLCSSWAQKYSSWVLQTYTFTAQTVEIFAEEK